MDSPGLLRPRSKRHRRSEAGELWLRYEQRSAEDEAQALLCEMSMTRTQLVQVGELC